MKNWNFRKWGTWSYWKQRNRWAPAAGIGAAMLVVLVLMGGRGDASVDLPTFHAESGPLTISVTESGTIKAREQVELRCEVEGQTTVIYLIPEGQQVKKGELLVELDASRLVDQKVDQEISVENAEAAFIRARENLAVAENQSKSDISKAELTYRFAQEDLTKYQEGEFPKLLTEARNRITIAKAELEQAKDTMEWSERLFAEDFISESERDGDKLAYQRRGLDQDLAIAEMDLLEQYEYKRRVAELESEVEQGELALERVTRKASADIVQAKADLRAKEAEWNRQKDKLAKLIDQLDKTKMYAPIDAMVVYATTGRGNFRGNDEPLEEGKSVREREELIYLPTANAQMAEIKIHESSLDKVAIGQPVRVTIDALPGRTFRGIVAKIAPLPDAQSMWMNPDLKVYNTEIHLDGELKDVRTGMTCRSEILVKHYEDVVYVPVQSVLRIGNEPTVFLKTRRGMTPQAVTLGMDNNHMVCIVDGLNAGDEVILTPPLESASAVPMYASEDPSLDPAASWPTGALAGDPRPAAAMDRGPERPLRDGEDRPDRTRRGGEEGPGGRRGQPDMENLTPEQREQMAERFQRMREASPEEREKMREEFRRTMPAGGGGGDARSSE